MANRAPREGRPGAHPPETVGQLLRSRRLAKGFTQSELADGICTRAYVAQIENGSRFPGPALLKRLAGKLGVPLEDFAPAYVSAPTAGVEHCLSLAKMLAKRGAVDEARRAYGHAERLYRIGGNPAADEAAVRETLAIILLHEGNYDESERILAEALADRLRTGRPTVALVEVYAAKGLCAAKRGDLRRAANMFQKAFNIVFALWPGSRSGQHPAVLLLQYEIVEWLMRLFILQRHFHTARTIYEWATGSWVMRDGAGDDIPPRLIVLRALAELGTGDPEAAAEALRNHLDSRAPGGDPRYFAAVHNNLAVAYRLLEDWEKARYHASVALDFWRRLSADAPGSHSSANELAYAAIALDEYDVARQALDFAKQPATDDYQLPDPIIVAESLLLEARLALSRRDTETALDLLQRAEDASAGVRWLETMVHIERAQATLAGGRPREDIQAALDALRASVAKWSV